MWVALVTDIPNQLVIRGVEHIVQGNRKLDDTQASAKMAARATHAVEQIGAQLISQLRQLIFVELAQVSRRANAIE
jgi:hypothetical protein